MNGLLGAAIAGAIGLVAGIAIAAAYVNRQASRAAIATGPQLPEPSPLTFQEKYVPTPSGSEAGDFIDVDEVARVLAVLPGASVLVDRSDGTVIQSSEQATALGLTTRDRIAVPEISRLVADAGEIGDVTQEEITVRRAPLAGGRIDLLARVAKISEHYVLILAEDLTGARRLDEVRRDFVANVSHELKTPVGALSILAEAVLSAADDPDAVRHFAGRMQIESTRLAALVADLVDLSRIQGDDPMENAERIDVDHVISEATDSMRLPAEAEDIELVTGAKTGLAVFGVESQLVTALRNLLANAVSYSPPQTRVAVGAGVRDGIVEITVTDQGIGIPSAEIDRIWERFYRVDQARSRVTGGTGLGLSIVKHVCRNHNGDVAVWSVEGEGSTFTLRLPQYRAQSERPFKGETHQ